MKPQYHIYLVPILLALTIVAGCNKSGEKKEATTQVAAKVNSTEITVSQINNVLARAGKVTPENAERAKREALERLINEELAKEQAISKKLDRSPNVMQLLEATKTELLARAYVEQVAAVQPKPTPEEVKKYYVEHPELFGERRVYNIEEFSLQAKEGLAASLQEQVRKGRTMAEIAAWLKAQEIPFVPNSGVRAAEQLPLDFLPRIAPMKDGEIRVFDVPSAPGGGIEVFRVVASKAAPVTEAQATPRIQQFLFSRKSVEAITADMKLLKEKAKVTYMGEFAASAAEAEAKAKAAAEAKAAAAAEAKAKAEAQARAQTDEISKARAAAEAKAKVEAEAQAKADEQARARRAAEAKAREAESKQAGSKPAQPINPDLEKGVRGLIR